MNYPQIHVHSSGLESLYEFVPKSVLPVDYDGEQPSMDELEGNRNGIYY